jgi:hypothetical protein
MPSGVVGGCGIHNDSHEGTNVRHHNCLDVKVGDDGVFIQQRVGHGLRGRGIRGSWDQLLGGDSLPFKIGDDRLFLIKELMGAHDKMTCGGSLVLGG